MKYARAPINLLITLLLAYACDQGGDESMGEMLEGMTDSPQTQEGAPDSSPNSMDPNNSPSPNPSPNPSLPPDATPPSQGNMCNGIFTSGDRCTRDTEGVSCSECALRGEEQCAQGACLEVTQQLAQCALERGCIQGDQVDTECIAQACGGEYSTLTNYQSCLASCPQIISCFVPGECNRCGLEYFTGRVIFNGGCFEETTPRECVGHMILLRPNGEFLETYQTTSQGEQNVTTTSGFWHTDCETLRLETCGDQPKTHTYRYLLQEDRVLLDDGITTGYTHYQIYSDNPMSFVSDPSDLSPQCPQ